MTSGFYQVFYLVLVQNLIVRGDPYTRSMRGKHKSCGATNWHAQRSVQSTIHDSSDFRVAIHFG